jgi:ornithine cyclodeaminase/alanine dehydrogenase-like protein (mu-crystallin family)
MTAHQLLLAALRTALARAIAAQRLLLDSGTRGVGRG